MSHCMLGVPANKTAHERSLSYSLWAHNGYNNGRWFFRRRAVHQRHMEPLLIKLCLSSDMFVCCKWMSSDECFWVETTSMALSTLCLSLFSLWPCLCSMMSTMHLRGVRHRRYSHALT